MLPLISVGLALLGVGVFWAFYIRAAQRKPPFKEIPPKNFWEARSKRRMNSGRKK